MCARQLERWAGMAGLASARYRGGRSSSAFRDRAAKGNGAVHAHRLPRKVPDMSIDPRPLPRTRAMCAALFVFAAIAAIPQVAAAQTVTICHIPPGNPANAHVITVSMNALPAHFAHGDFVGPSCACTATEGTSCGANQAPCCAGLKCVADLTGVFSCAAGTSSNTLPQGSACTASSQCDPLYPCNFYGPGDGVCGG